MVAVRQKKQKPKLKVATKVDLSEALKSNAWEKVKVRGKVISDEGLTAGFEGLVGLEVLDNYNSDLVEKIKKTKRKAKDKRAEPKAQKRKPKKAAEEDEANSSSDDEEQHENEDAAQKLTKAERIAKKLQKLKERREKRKAQRKLKQKQGGAANAAPKQQNKEAKKPKDKKSIKKKHKKAEEEEEEDELNNAEYPAERFALLRPPAPYSDDDDEAPELLSSNNAALSLDELEHWNGLGVPDVILRALAEKGFKSPTQIQTMTLPAAILGKKDILGAAETGSGKTLAFGIPLLTGIMELKAKNSLTGIRKANKQQQHNAEADVEAEMEAANLELTPSAEELNNYAEDSSDDDEEEQSNVEDDDDDEVAAEKRQRKNGALYAIVLTPTRELAVQVRDHLVAAAKYTGIKIAAVFGGLSIAKQQRLLRQCPEIVVATPGRFWELYQQENAHLSKLDDISFLVIDETDRMVEKGHFEELRSLLKVLNSDEQRKQARQNFVFSATLTLVHDLPDHMQNRNVGKRNKFVKQTPGMKIQSLIEELGISQPKIVDITSSQQTAQTLTECRLICPIDHKDYYLYYFVQRHPGRTIVFCNSIDGVKRLATLFGLLNCNPLPLHANMIQKQRLKNLERFRDNPNGFLIATDVAARGLDIPNVEHVIHYQVPRTSENYVHRSGRTARANKNGLTVMFMEPGEVKSYIKLYKTLDRTEDLPLFPVTERYLAAVKQRVNLAREVDKQELKLRRTQAEIGWMKKRADEMDMIIEGYNDESGSDQDEDPFVQERKRDRMHLVNVRAQLKSLLCKQIFPQGFSFKYPTSSGQLQTPDFGAERISAVKVVRDAIDDLKLAKKMRNKRKKKA